MLQILKVIDVTLRVLAVLAVIVGMAALTFNQVMVTVDNHQQAEAEAACMKYGETPHAAIIDETVYCYVTFQGTEMIAPLEVLIGSYRDSG